MNRQISEFTDKIIEHIKCKKVHKYIEAEIEDHIEMLKAEFIEEGLNEKEAYDKAVLQMGDAKEIGISLNKTHKLHIEWPIIILACLLLIFGTFLIPLSASTNLALFDESYYKIQFIQRIIQLIVGISVFLAAYFADYHLLKKYSFILYLAGIGLLLFVLFYGLKPNEDQVFIRLDYYELYPIAVSLICLGYSDMAYKFINHKNNLIKYILCIIVTSIPLLLLLIRSVFNFLILFITLISIITICIYQNDRFKSKPKVLALFYGIIVDCIALYILNKIIGNEYVKARILSFITNSGNNFFTDLLFNSKFIGASVNENLMLAAPDPSFILGTANSNFVLASTIYNIGSLSGIVLIFIAGFILLRMFKDYLGIKDNYGKMITISIFILFLLRFSFHIFMNLGFVPTTSAYLPFVSNGLPLIGDMFILGVFLNVYRTKDILIPKLEC